MWLISQDRKRAVNTETKVELRVEKIVSSMPVSDAGWYTVEWGDFRFATCKVEYDAIECLVAIALLTMDTVVAKTPEGMTYKKLDIHTPDIGERLAEAIKDIIQRSVKNSS